MKVSLINYTQDAVNLLLFTKNTRLQMSPDTYNDIANWSDEKKHDELRYMARTIPSSWEFVDYVFMVQGVTRAYTHQQVRTRAASYAQQTMRVLDVSGWTYGTGPSIASDETLNALYEQIMGEIARGYDALVEAGAAIEDARGVLPTNIHTNIVVKFNLRTFAELVKKRSSLRTQSEYRDVLDGMKEAVLAVHPWASLFLESRTAKAFDGINRAAEILIGLGQRDAAIGLMKDADVLRADL